MKFKRYLLEQVRYSKDALKHKPKALRLINKYKRVVDKELSWYEYNVTTMKLCMIMSSIYMQDKIRFIYDESPQFKGYSYVIGSDFYKGGDLELFLSNSVVDSVYTNKKLFTDKFTNEFNCVLAHALVKRDRVLKMGDEFEWIGYVPIKKHIADNIDRYVYITKQELEDDNFSPTRSMIFDLIGHLPVYKKFKKDIS